MNNTTIVPLSRGKHAIVDTACLSLIQMHNWYFSKRGYAVTNCRTEEGRITVTMHRVILGNPVCSHIDHINGDKLDNRLSNLRMCTAAQNSMNRGNNKGKKYKGVSWHKRWLKFQAYIKADGVLLALGYYNSEDEAALAYNEAAIRLHGEFAKLNCITPPTQPSKQSSSRTLEIQRNNTKSAE